MQADGALDQKLRAWIEVNKRYAEAIEKYQGAWVPQIQMGGGQNSSGGGSQDLINLLMAKTAKDLSLDVKVKE